MSASTLALTTQVGWALLHFLWQGALVGAATALGLLALRNRRPQTRYLFGCAALLVCLGLPLLSLHGQAVNPGMAAAGLAAGAAPVTDAIAPAASLLSWLDARLPMLVALWLACVALLALRMLSGLWWVHRLRRTAAPVIDPAWQQRFDALARRFALGRPVALRSVADLCGPMTAGWWRPVVFVPASLFVGMPAELLEALLAHELAHIARHDYLINLIQHVAEMLLFFHPAVWWISRQIRVERELIADELAASMLGEPRRLALALQNLASRQSQDPQFALAAHGGNLMTRIQRLVRPETQAFNWKAAAAILASVTISMGMVAHAALPAEGAAATQAAAAGPQFVNLSVKIYKDGALQAEPRMVSKLGDQASIRVDGTHLALVPEESNGEQVALTIDLKGVAESSGQSAAKTLRLKGKFDQEMAVDYIGAAGAKYRILILPTLTSKLAP